MRKNNPFLSGIILLGIILLPMTSWTDKKPAREFYQITVYHFTSGDQEKTLDNYLRNALLPALHRNKINNAGIFKAWSNDTAANKSIYVFMPFNSLEATAKLSGKLNDDAAYLLAGSDYINAAYNNPPYSRMETILLQAFPLAPQMQLPALHNSKKDRVYELRSYESATEKKFDNKVEMFNKGDEIGLFKRLNFNAVFYGSVIAGCKMPNLMYMTSFENRLDRDEHWKAFGNDPYWKKLSAMPEYQNNVSHIDITFLYPTDYSDF